MIKKIIVSLALVSASLLVGGTASAAKPVSVTISVPDAQYGGVTTATVVGAATNPDRYVYVQCYNPDYVFAAFYLVEDGQAELGPLASSIWPNTDADCTATVSYFTKNGFGKQVDEASTTFHVSSV